jgi:peptidoglycan/xylan/chitin deacetylase (PgdA/CDA1 family)
MYHRIGSMGPGQEPRYVVSTEAFRAQLAHLRGSGYAILGVGGFLARSATTPAVVLTFDDGCDTDLTLAAPLIAEHGGSATFYVVPQLLGRPGYLAEGQVLELSRLGFEIGSHSMTHVYLNDLDDGQLRYEVEGSRARLEDILGRRVWHFACPGGRNSARVRAAVRDAGYTSLATSAAGLNTPRSDAFALRRLDVQRGTSPVEFARLCRGTGLYRRRLRGIVLDAAKSVLGNGDYDRVRRRLLSPR